MLYGMRRFGSRLQILLFVAVCGATALAATRQDSQDPRLHGGFRNPKNDGWIFVHLEGSPSAIGFQHGYLLSAEIEDTKRAIELSTTHGVNHSWAELRDVSQKYFWPRVPDEYRQELQGMAEGLKAHGSNLDVTDLVTMNAYMEFSYYYDKSKHQLHEGHSEQRGRALQCICRNGALHERRAHRHRT